MRTVGSGGTYATFAEALSGMSTPEDIRQVGVSSGVGTSTPVALTLSGPMVIDSSSPHGGNPLVGHTISSSLRCIYLTLSGSGSLEIKGLHLISGAAGLDITIQAGSTVTLKIHDCIFYSLSGANISVTASAADGVVQIWDCEAETYMGIGTAFVFSRSAGTFTVENCSVYNASTGYQITGAMTIRNCVGIYCTTVFSAGRSAATGYNNASTDSTATTGWLSQTGSFGSIVPTSQFVSTSHSNADYLKISSAGVCDDGGTAPQIPDNTVGIRGNTRNSPYSIGSDEFILNPTFVSCTPNTCAITGGRNVSVVGTGFQSGLSVTFGGTPATNINFVSSTNFTCDVPAHALGQVDIVITNTDTGTVTATNAFTYTPLPTFTSCTPDHGSDFGGTVAQIVGTGFLTGASVSFGGAAATQVAVFDSEHISCKTPAHAYGTVDVTVTNADLGSATGSGAFTYDIASVTAPDNVEVSADIGEALTGVSRVNTRHGFGLGDVLNKIAKMLTELKLCSTDAVDFAEFKTLVTDLDVISPPKKWVEPWPDGVKVPERMSWGRAGLSGVVTSNLNDLSSAVAQIAKNLSDIKAAVVGATTFNDFKSAMTGVKPLRKSDDSRV